jgi:hypothetical protein
VSPVSVPRCLHGFPILYLILSSTQTMYSESLFDRTGWFAQLQKSADRSYPEPLRIALVRKNQLPLTIDSWDFVVILVGYEIIPSNHPRGDPH